MRRRGRLSGSRRADSIFLTIRGFRSAPYGPLLAQFRDQLKPEAIGEIEAGLALTSAAWLGRWSQHGQLLERMRRFRRRTNSSSAP